MTTLNPLIKSLLQGQNLHKTILPAAANPFSTDGVEIIAMSAHSLQIPQIKYLPALWMFECARQAGILDHARYIVEATSGNTGLALGMLAPQYGFTPDRVIVIGPRDIAPGKRASLGIAGVSYREPDPDETPAMTATKLGKAPGYLHLNQYGNPHNAEAHYHWTGRMVLWGITTSAALFSVAVGSGGTVIGVSKFLKQECPGIRIIGAMCAPKAEIPGVRDLERMKEITLPWRTHPDVITEVMTRPAYLGATILARFACVPSGPSGGLSYVALLRCLKKAKDEGSLSELPRNEDGKIVAGFLVADTFQPYPDRFTAHLPGSIVTSINTIPWELVYDDSW